MDENIVGHIENGQKENKMDKGSNKGDGCNMGHKITKTEMVRPLGQITAMGRVKRFVKWKTRNGRPYKIPKLKWIDESLESHSMRWMSTDDVRT